MKILFFIETFRSGGKERRLLELMILLKKHTSYQMMLVMTEDDIHYNEIYQLDIPIKIIKRNIIKKDPSVFFKFYKICKKFNPSLIHVWGNMPAFYSIPASIILKKPIINNQITDIFGISVKQPFSFILHKLNFYFSRIIISNSIAGLKKYNVNKDKSKVIYNGVSLSRFNILKNSDIIRDKFNIKTKFSIIMVGTFSKYKNFDLFIDAAKHYQNLRKDITFIGVGSGENLVNLQQRLVTEKIKNVILTGKIQNVEELISVCDIGVLISPYGEGISNSIIEYMALGKPVIASNKGGNSELIENNINGILLKNDSLEDVCNAINFLISDKILRNKMSLNNKKKIENEFSAKRMMNEFLSVYENI